jgi:hypothetical protein
MPFPTARPGPWLEPGVFQHEPDVTAACDAALAALASGGQPLLAAWLEGGAMLLGGSETRAASSTIFVAAAARAVFC